MNWRWIPLLLIFALSYNQTVAQQRGDYIDFQKLESLTATEIDSIILAQTGQNGTLLGVRYAVDVYFVSYYTRDFHPDSLTIATGLVGVATNFPCDKLGIVTFGHGLSLKDRETPSTNSPGNIYALITKGLASNGFIVASPDYIHLGAQASPGFQGFQHADTEAGATMDLVRAVRKYAADNTIGLSGQIFLSGYSQGGHSSLATAKLMQIEHPFEFEVTGVSSGGGTYDMSGIAADSLLSPTRTTPERQSLPLVVRSFVEAYKDSLTKYGLPADPEEAFDTIFESPYDTILAEMLLRNTALYNNSLLDSIPSRMLDDTFEIKARNDPNFFFRNFLALNDLYDWVPQMPVRLFQSEDDIEDPIANTYFTLDQFQQNGAPDVALTTVTGFSHPDAAVPWVLLARSFFTDLRESCVTDIEPIERPIDIKVFPNPASNYLSVHSSDLNAVANRLFLYNVQGQLVKDITFTDKITLDIRQLPKGSYLLRVSDSRSMHAHRIVTIQ